jgi:hypothetical protein
VNSKGLNETLFKVSRNFYLLYPQIGELLSLPIHPTLSDKSWNEKSATPSHQLEVGGLLKKSATPSHQFVTAASEILGKLSFSHIREIMLTASIARTAAKPLSLVLSNIQLKTTKARL